MKAGIHPEYYETDMVCACGAVYHTRSTRRDIKIGICAACHPFFTGEQKFVDTAGRVEKFARRYGSMKAARAGVTQKTVTPTARSRRFCLWTSNPSLRANGTASSSWKARSPNARASFRWRAC